MPNEQNLIPFDKRTESEQREIASKGGKKSGEVRRQQKTMREYAKLLLGLDITDKRKRNKLSNMGVPDENLDNKMLIIVALMNEAQTGNVQACKELRSLLDEDEDNSDKSITIADTIIEAYQKRKEESNDR